SSPCFVAGFKLSKEWRERIHFFAVHGPNAVPREGFGQGAFADFAGVDLSRVGDVRNHTLMLRALPRNPIELGKRQLQLAVIERLNGLYCALAECLAAENQRPMVILHRAGEDLRSRGGQTIHQHGERALVEGAWLLVGEDIYTAVAIAYQHGWS